MILSFDEFLEHINNVTTELSKGVVWYRGHSDSAFKLLPTLKRQLGYINEAGMFYDYKSHAAGINGSNKDDWELLLDMQHYGLPTRMLDWTSSLGTAMYFALKDNPVSPCIWLLDPFSLSLKSTNEETIFDVSVMNHTNSNLNTNFNVFHLITNKSAFNVPFAIQPPHGNRRIAAQRGMFSVHGNSSLPIEEQCPEAVRKIIIPNSLIKPISQYLGTLGIDDLSLFPDQYGLSCLLKKKYGVVNS